MQNITDGIQCLGACSGTNVSRVDASYQKLATLLSYFITLSDTQV